MVIGGSSFGDIVGLGDFGFEGGLGSREGGGKDGG